MSELNTSELLPTELQLLDRAWKILDFHAARCPLNPDRNFSGMEEHLAEYRKVRKEIRTFMNTRATPPNAAGAEEAEALGKSIRVLLVETWMDGHRTHERRADRNANELLPAIMDGISKYARHTAAKAVEDYQKKQVSPCPYVAMSDDGTHYCNLPVRTVQIDEMLVKVVEDERARLRGLVDEWIQESLEREDHAGGGDETWQQRGEQFAMKQVRTWLAG